MKEDLIIFGIQDASRLGKFYLDRDSSFRVVAYCVHGEYLPEATELDEVPIFSLCQVGEKFSPEEVCFFAPLYAKEMNRVRRRIFEEVKGMGYRFATYVSTRTTNYSDSLGQNVFVGEDCTLQPFTQVGDNTVVWAGNHVGHHSVVGRHCYIAGQVAISGRVIVGDHCFIGGNATIRDGIELGEGTLVGMHAAVMEDTPPWTVWRGVPARMAKSGSLEVQL